VVPSWTIDLDHIDPLVPVTTTYLDLVNVSGIDGLVDRLWCSENNLEVLCENCHNIKSAKERKLRPKPVRKKKKAKK
jgi:5-methylcytosine-specific restriction endonuclease McrA